MIRKLTASALLWLMMVVTATSQPGFSYCLCLKTFFAGQCECVSIVGAENCPRTASATICECESACYSQEVVFTSSGDCAVDLFVPQEGFFGSLNTVAPERSDLAITPGYVSQDEDSLIPSLRARVHGIRGSPPRQVVDLSVPLRLRYSVFLV